MDKVDILFVRACKGSNSESRLLNLHKRFYIPTRNIEENKRVIIAQLGDIIQNSNPYTVSESFQIAKEAADIGTESFTDFMLKKYVSRIYNTKASQFKGFIPPLYFRKKVNILTC